MEKTLIGIERGSFDNLNLDELYGNELVFGLNFVSDLETAGQYILLHTGHIMFVIFSTSPRDLKKTFISFFVVVTRCFLNSVCLS